MAEINVSGDVLHFDDYPQADGNADRDPLVWLHGFSFNAALYESVIRLLPSHRHIAIDMRGHGRSASADTDMTFERIVSDVRAITAELGIERFVMVGHSIGNAVGMRFAATYPDSVHAGVAIAGVPANGMPEAARAGLAAIADTAGDVDSFLTTFTAMFRHPGHDATLLSAAQVAAGMTADGLRMAGTEPMRDDSAHLADAITAPWLFLVPEEDTAVPAALQLAGAQMLSETTIVPIADEGHGLPQENPAAVAEQIQAFLTGLHLMNSVS